MERDLLDTPAFSVDPDEDFLQHIEAARLQLYPCQHIAMVHTEAAGQVAQRQRQDPAVGPVQDMTQQPAEPSHVSLTPWYIAGSNQDLRLVTVLPELLQEQRAV